MNWDYATKYSCQTCGADKWLPERPLSPTPRVRTGCENCKRIRVHTPVGTSY